MLETIPLDAASELSFGSSTWLDDEAPEGNPVDLIFLEDQIIDTGRWSIYHFIVFRYGAEFYGFSYDEPATEYQETTLEDRFEANPVPIFPLVAEEVMTTAYRRADVS